MRKFAPFLFLAFVLAGCGVVQTSDPATLMQQGNAPQATPTVSPTWTPIPEPTVDYLATAQVSGTEAAQARWDALHAQETAVAAQVAIVTFTAGAEQMTAQSVAYTATSDDMTRVSSWATQAVAPTYVPMTEQARNTEIALQSGQMTAAVEQPTQIVRIAKAEAEAQYAGAQKFADVVMTFGAAIFFLGLTWLIVWATRRNPSPQNAPTTQPDKPVIPINDYAAYTRVNVARDTVGGQGQYAVVPISEDDFDALALGVEQYGLAVNQWDGTKRPSPFTASNKRDTILAIRAWLRANGLAAEQENSRQLALTEEGKRLFEDWLRNGALPHNIRFNAETTENHGVSAHAHDFHGHEKDAEAVGDPENGEVGEVEVIEPEPVRGEPMYHPIGLNARSLRKN